MGLISGLLRVQTLKQMQLDLEFKIQTLTQTKMQLANQGYELVSIGTDLDPESPEFKHIEQRRHKLELMEKKIDAELQRHQAMLKMTETEVESANKIVENAIARSFKYG